MTNRMRADLLLVQRGLFESRAKAQAAIAAGLVTADNVVVLKPSETIAHDASLSATPDHPWVSRGGVKLAAALDHFQFDPAGRICLDVGASTGGFTEVLVTRAAKRVYALDVGHAQLHPRIRAMPQVISLEGTDIRALDDSRMPEKPEFITVDVSFISLKKVLPAVTDLARPRAQIVALIKPQFEAGRARVKNGIVRDPAIHGEICDDVAAFVASLGWGVRGIVPSPIEGGDGNREFFVGAQRD